MRIFLYKPFISFSINKYQLVKEDNYLSGAMMAKTMNKLVIFSLIFFTHVSNADWTLCNQVSNLNFVTSQNDKLTEVYSFSNMEGTISDQGNVLFKIDLSSVQTNNSVRNLRLQDLVFETNKFQESSVSLDLGDGFFSALEIDKAKEMPVQVSLNLHGITHKIDTLLLVTRLKNDCLLIISIEPIVISLKDFDLLAGLEKLRQLTKLDSISKKVTVSVNLFFRSNITL